MNWERYYIALMYNLASALPWILGGLGLLAATAWSPIGRALHRHLTARREEEALLEELLTQVSAMRAELAETTERLDGTDRLLRGLQPPSLPVRRPVTDQSLPPQVTPH